MSQNKGLLAVIVVLLVALVGLVCVGVGALVYCSSNSCFGSTNVLTTGTPAPGATRAPAGSQPTRPPSSGGANVLRLPGGGDPPTLDPATVNDTTSAEYTVEIFSGLVTLNKDLKIVPDIAESWDVSQDRTSYTFHLRKDVKFHDGRPVTAQDFKYSMERAADPRTRSTTAPNYLGDIVGVLDKYTGKAKDISGIKVIDDYTLQITIDGPKSYFLAKMTFPTAFVVDKNNVERGSQPWYLKPNGTGPYKLKEWSQGQRIVLSKNQDYVGDPKPSVDEVTYINAGGSRMTMYENGDLEATPVTIADIERVNDPSNPLNKDLTVSPELNTGFLVFNVRKPPFDDPNVRRAFAMAIDRQKLVKVVAKDMTVPAKGILPVAFPGYNENLQAIPYDPAQAKQLLQQSKYAGKLPDITWNTVGAGGTTGADTQAIAQMLKDNLGVEVSIQQIDWPSFLNVINDPQSNPFQMFDIGWSADYVDPENFLDLLFHTGSYQNWASYSNSEVDKLLDQARVENDNTKRIDLYRQAEQKIINDVPAMPLAYGRAYWLTKPYVKGVFYPPLIIPRLKYISIQK
jgi:oligopeptide transport system substrate-binding protein